ncbi:Bifunctional purine biosynthetic protein ade1 [Kappamyces sp. JEL0680]|nr:Bifunctional purine biosynthetic protein ade1 [Kappamyces sp. JEL0680]
MGDHDENIHPGKLAAIIGADMAKKVEEMALRIYTTARDYAAAKGIIIADTKFEFGVDDQGNLILADEVLTPDSSRFWPADQYVVGQSQPSFDKQYLRDYLLSIHFDKKTGVDLPADVVSNTVKKYSEVCKILTGIEPVW